MVYNSLGLLGVIVIIIFLAFIGWHVICDLIKTSKEKVMRKEMEEATQFAILKLRHEAYCQQQKQQMSKQQLMAQQQMATPWTHGGRSPGLDLFERTQLALIQLQTLFLAGELEKQELFNATKMAASVDRENLTVVEEIIKAKLG